MKNIRLYSIVTFCLCCLTIKSSAQNTILNCPAQYDSTVFWGQNGEGSFSDVFEDVGWIAEKIPTIENDTVYWKQGLHKSINPSPIFADQIDLESPTGCTGVASFPSEIFQRKYNPNYNQPYKTLKADLISPIMDCSAAKHVLLEFYQLYAKLNHNSYISYSIDDGVTWLDTILVPTKNLINNITSTEKIQLPIPAFRGKSKCRIKFIANQDFYYWSLDDVVLKDQPYTSIEGNPNFYAGSPDAVIPMALVNEFPLGIDIDVFSNEVVPIVNVLAEVIDENENILHLDKVVLMDVQPSDKEVFRVIFPMTYNPPKIEGTYKIFYSVEYGNNQKTKLLEKTFTVGGDLISKLPIDSLNTDYYDFNHNITKPSFSFGNYYYFPKSNCSEDNQKPITLDKAIAGLEQGAPNGKAKLLSVVYEWNDLNNDGIAQASERQSLAEGEMEITNSIYHNEVELFDSNNKGEKYALSMDRPHHLLIMNHVFIEEGEVSWRYPRVNTSIHDWLPYNLQSNIIASDSLGINSYGGFIGEASTKEELNSIDFFPEEIDYTNYTPILIGCQLKSSLNSVESNGIKIYPNPTSSRVFIDLPSEIKNTCIVTIENTMGMTLYRENVSAHSDFHTINVANYQSGTYIIRVEDEGTKHYNQMVIINNH